MTLRGVISRQISTFFLPIHAEIGILVVCVSMTRTFYDKGGGHMELTLFEQFPEPVFYLRGGRIQYSNGAALALEPTWAAGADVPEALTLQPDEAGVFSCTLAGQGFHAAATHTDGGLLLVLRRAVELPQSAVLGELPIQIRELIQNLYAAAQRLEPVVAESGQENARMQIAVLRQSFYRLLRLARHLELAQQAAAPPTERELPPLNLAQLCRATVYGAAKLAEQAGVRFQGEIPGGVLICAGDAQFLEILLLELISNAIKAAGKGGEAGLRLSSTGKRAHITVWDSGAGMSQAELTALMDGASPDSLPKPGTGLRLGLPIARYVANLHGGAVLLESREGQGLRATVSLPLTRAGRGKLSTPRPTEDSGFPLSLVLLSDALPWTAFEGL
jgi:signal transduction histidine kinase